MVKMRESRQVRDRIFRYRKEEYAQSANFHLDKWSRCCSSPQDALCITPLETAVRSSCARWQRPIINKRRELSQPWMVSNKINMLSPPYCWERTKPGIIYLHSFWDRSHTRRLRASNQAAWPTGVVNWVNPWSWLLGEKVGKVWV